ncbi:hypothetical protein G6O67_000803 [Ophiocordyceps sinensis]|uniref:Uncharacterized protein n=1 Tax=Ophiocordyceps sinensis TaxID=72228 RepID=A0A8H4Q063_9HYPO|nr:hypothetical protein G6O67_000803 [Ophiocordyceps sinensis]
MDTLCLAENSHKPGVFPSATTHATPSQATTTTCRPPKVARYTVRREVSKDFLFCSSHDIVCDTPLP